MAKRSLQSALARKEEPAPVEPTATIEKPTKARDNRIITSLRIEPDLLATLKVLAVHERMRVNEVIIEAIKNHLALKGQRAA